MIRQVSALAVMFCLSEASLFAQTTEPQIAELTVTIASADVHKFPTVASPVIDKAPRGATLEISRNLGSWVEVPWPTAEGGVAFLHVNTGLVTRGAMPALVLEQPIAAPPTSNASAAQAVAVNNSSPSHAMYVSLPSHMVGLGGRMNATTQSFGANVRTWWGKRLGLQFDVSHSAFDGIEGAGHLSSIQIAPSMLYSLPDGLMGSLWLRPYLGAGGHLYRATSSSGLAGSEDSTDKGVGIQAFGGTEVTFSGAPRFVMSADVGYRWSQTTFTGIDPNKIALSFSAHWYVK
jgi:hypothetical protein